MSLLQGVLRSQTEEITALEKRLKSAELLQGNSSVDKDDSDDDLVNVVSLPTTPDRTRPPSPIRGASARPIPGPLHITSSRDDPLKAFPTEISQRIFGHLPIKDLAKCALVSRKWRKSQTINYVWFIYYRKDNFQDDSLPPGKWTRRESKQNWRVTYLKTGGDHSPRSTGFSKSSGFTTPSSNSGYQTPREMKEEQWKLEAETAKPGKVEMRGFYKELGGRKAKTKMKLGSSGIRDKGGWANGESEY